MASAMDELVFEGRHKLYGAYFIRANYRSRIKRGFTISLLVYLAILILPPLLKDLFRNHEAAIEINVPAHTAENQLSTPPESKEEDKPAPGKLIGNMFAKPKSTRDSIAEKLKKDTLDVTKDTLDVDTSGPERMPMFAGGNKLIPNYFSIHLIYPWDFKQSRMPGGIQWVYCTIAEDGTIDDVEAMEPMLTIPIGHAAEEVVKNMPKWWPAKHLNQKVKTRIKIPVEFKDQSK